MVCATTSVPSSNGHLGLEKHESKPSLKIPVAVAKGYVQLRHPAIGNTFFNLADEQPLPLKRQQSCPPSLCKECEESDVSTAKTLLVRNIPFDFTLNQFLKEIENHGFFSSMTGESSIDFVYLPFMFGTAKLTKQNAGYGFVNFTCTKEAQRFRATFAIQKTRKQRKIVIRDATVQGLVANLTSWQKGQTSRIKSPDYMPVVISGGKPIPCSEYLLLVGGVRGIEKLSAAGSGINRVSGKGPNPVGVKGSKARQMMLPPLPTWSLSPSSSSSSSGIE